MMCRKIIAGQIILVAGAMISIAISPAFGASGQTGCKRATVQMFRACQFDIRDNLHETIANCTNIGDASERDACRATARADFAEERGECRDVRSARRDACEALGEDRYDADPLADSSVVFIGPDDVPGVYAPNPYVTIEAGHTYVLRSGADGEEVVVVHVTEDTRDILDVPCRVVKDVVVEVSDDNGGVEYEAVESTDDWFAQDTDGNVYYCGEVARNFEDGILRDLDGSFEAGIDFAKGGLLIGALPTVGVVHRQEFALGEAEDIVKYVSLAAAPAPAEGGDNPAFPCSPGQCLQTLEWAPLDPASAEYKYYLPGTGFVLAVGMEDGELTGEREELVCVGGSLDVLDDPACGIADPAALREALCSLAPDAFCDE